MLDSSDKPAVKQESSDSAHSALQAEANSLREKLTKLEPTRLPNIHEIGLGISAAIAVAAALPGRVGNVGKGLALGLGLATGSELAFDKHLSGPEKTEDKAMLAMLGTGLSAGLIGKKLAAEETTGMLNKSTFGAKNFDFLKTGKPIEAISLHGLVSELHISRNLDAQIPLNVFSKSDEPLGKALSNFAHTPFELDNKKYASIEAFYSSLKFQDPLKREEIATLYGSYAKSAANSAKGSVTEYNGQSIVLGSPEHHELLTRAIRAKLEQNPDLMTEFVASHPRPIVHETGRSAHNSRFPASTFTNILTQLREEYASAKGYLPSSEQSKNWLESVEVAGGKSEIVQRDKLLGNDGTIRSISDSLAAIKEPSLIEHHDLDAYAKAFADVKTPVQKVLGGGGDTIALHMQDDSVLKIGTRELPVDGGVRAFDAPILNKGVRNADGYPIRFYSQPMAQPASSRDLSTFVRDLQSTGYHMHEPFLTQIGKIEDRTVLLDPWAVTKVEKNP